MLLLLHENCRIAYVSCFDVRMLNVVFRLMFGCPCRCCHYAVVPGVLIGVVVVGVIGRGWSECVVMVSSCGCCFLLSLLLLLNGRRRNSSSEGFFPM